MKFNLASKGLVLALLLNNNQAVVLRKDESTSEDPYLARVEKFEQDHPESLSQTNEATDTSNSLKQQIEAQGLNAVPASSPYFNSDLVKNDAIHNVISNTLNRIEGQTTNFGDEVHGKSAAIDAISKAAASGAYSRDMHDLSGTPDFEVHHETVVDHRGSPFFPPAVVGQHTSVIENTPKSASVSNENRPSVMFGYEPKTIVSNGGSKEILHKSTGVALAQPGSEIIPESAMNQHQNGAVNSILGSLVEHEESVKNEEPYQLRQQIVPNSAKTMKVESYQETVVKPENEIKFHQKYIDNMFKNMAEQDKEFEQRQKWIDNNMGLPKAI